MSQTVLTSEDLSRDPGDSVGIFVKVICWPNYPPKLWNELPSVITNKPSLNSFSKALKRYLIDGNCVNINNSNNTNSTRNQNHPSNHISSLANNRLLNQPFVSRWNQNQYT